MNRYIVAHSLDKPKPKEWRGYILNPDGMYFAIGSAPMIMSETLDGLGRHIRQLCPSDVREIEDIDRQIADLQERRRHFLAWAFGNNPPLSADEVKGMVRE